MHRSVNCEQPWNQHLCNTWSSSCLLCPRYEIQYLENFLAIWLQYLQSQQTLALKVENHRAHVTVTQDKGEPAPTININQNVINVYEGKGKKNNNSSHIVRDYLASRPAGSCQSTPACPPTTAPPPPSSSCTTTTTSTTTITTCTTLTDDSTTPSTGMFLCQRCPNNPHELWMIFGLVSLNLIMKISMEKDWMERAYNLDKLYDGMNMCLAQLRECASGLLPGFVNKFSTAIACRKTQFFNFYHSTWEGYLSATLYRARLKGRG